MIYEWLFLSSNFVGDEFQNNFKVGAFTTNMKNVVQSWSSEVNTVTPVT